MPIEVNGQTVGDIQLNGNTIDEVTLNGTVVYSSGPEAGTHYYLIRDTSSLEVLHYELPNPFDLANKGSPTSNLNSNLFRIDNVIISNDGTLFYVSGSRSNNAVEKYTLSTPFNLNSASLDTTITSLNQPGELTCFQLADNGTKLYMNESAQIQQRILSTPFDLATHGNVVATLSGEASDGPGDVAFKPDGTAVSFGHRGSSLIVTYDLSTPFDIATASNKRTFNATSASGDSDPSCVKWNGNGATAFVRHASPDMVNQYNTNTPYSVSGMSFAGQVFNNPSFAAGGQDFNYNF